jgi:hypothetical protein
MSTNSLRLIAVAVALIIAVLTGAATGLLSGEPDCPAAAAGPTATSTAANTGLGKSGTNTPDEPTTTGTGAGTQRAAACTTQQPFGFKAALTAFVGALFVGAALLLLLLLTARRPAGAAPVSGPPGRGGQADADRRALVQASIYVRDRVTSKALGDRLGAALHEAGITTLEPTGVRFDPAHHEAGGTTPTGDPALNGQISGVEVPGYVDRDGRVLRAPIVTVFQSGRSAGGPTGAQPTIAQPATGARGPGGKGPQSGPPTGPHTTQQPRREQPR